MEITIFEFKRIMGEEAPPLKVFSQNIFCPNCFELNDNELIDYVILLTEENNVLLKGRCSVCNDPAARHIETGENPSKSKIIEEIRISRK